MFAWRYKEVDGLAVSNLAYLPAIQKDTVFPDAVSPAAVSVKNDFSHLTLPVSACPVSASCASTAANISGAVTPERETSEQAVSCPLRELRGDS